MMDVREQVRGAVYGFAFGDAWGNVTEFMGHEEILEKQPQPPEKLVITDDTQMSIYNIKALKEIQSWDLQGLGTDVWLQNQVRVVFADQHLQFFYDEDNDRAPGLTCLDALQKYSQVTQPVTGYEGASNWSKGCGTVMRAPWLGLTGWNRDTVAHLAVLQAQTTHGDPVGWVASAVVALLMKDLFEYRITLTGDDELFNHCVKLTEEITHLFDETVLLGRAADFSAGLRTLTRRWELFASSDENVDMNLFFGEGWFSDEAFYNAVASANLYRDNPLQGIKRLVYTSGDSDSIAAIGGGLLGVTTGDRPFSEVPGKLEPRYQVELEDVVNWLTELNT